MIHGLADSGLPISEVSLYDVDSARTKTVAALSQELAPFPIRAEPVLETALEGSQYVLSSIRVGGIASRARDERTALAHGFAGQETTGPAGAAMALRTIPVVLEQVRVIEKTAPDAWYISFTNPAGLISQAVSLHSRLRAIGICDTPAELFHNIANVVGSEVWCDYAGLNHLGWVRRVMKNGVDLMPDLLKDPAFLRRLYSANLFDPELIAALGLIPTEYLFFYYSRSRALANQRRANATRGAEIEKMNVDLFAALGKAGGTESVAIYTNYLKRRNASYMKLESESVSAFSEHEVQPNPFAAATGYHKIAVETLLGLNSDTPREIVLNVANQGSVQDLADEDVVEVPCDVTRHGPVPKATGRLPEQVRGLVIAVKTYEQTLIQAATYKSKRLAQLALLEYPLIGDWEAAQDVLSTLIESDASLSYLV